MSAVQYKGLYFKPLSFPCDCFFFHSKYKGAQLLLTINFTNFALTMCEDCTEEYWPEVMAVQLEQVQSVSGLLHGTWTKLVYLEFIGFCKQNQGLSGNQSKGFNLTQDYLAI